jgi:hypothetical protein
MMHLISPFGAFIADLPRKDPEISPPKRPGNPMIVPPEDPPPKEPQKPEVAPVKEPPTRPSSHPEIEE